ncbi:MAG: histidine kinase dimerization/phospho-acceptor domain-containing protein [Anaerolineae bacterium]
MADPALTGVDIADVPGRGDPPAGPGAPVPSPASADDGASSDRAGRAGRMIELTLPSLRGIGSPLRGIVASLRWRLTLTYTLVVFLMLSSFSLGAYYYFAERAITDIFISSRDGANFVATSFKEALDRSAQVSQSFRNLPDADITPAARNFIRTFIIDFVQHNGIDAKLDELRLPGLDFQLFLANGQRIYSSRESALALQSDESGQLELTPMDDPIERLTHIIPISVRQNVAARGFDAYIAPFGQETMYVFSRPVWGLAPGDGKPQPVAYIQILTSLAPHNRALSQLRRMLVLGTLFATFMSLLIGAALAQTAIAPIGRIQRTADKINREQDLGRRIDGTGSEDELGRLAVTINLMLDRIEGMFDRQRHFLADVSHELRTPLTTIRGEVELMGRTGHADPEALAAVQAEAERMSRMIDDLLMLARADSGVPVVKDPRPVSIDALLLDIYQQACMLSRGSHRIELDVDHPAYVNGDRDRLKQLVLNLVMNALAHTPAGTLVRIGLQRSGRDVVIAVADDGPGISADDAAHIFDRFYCADKARACASGGTGLGLAIVQSIAQGARRQRGRRERPSGAARRSAYAPAGG